MPSLSFLYWNSIEPNTYRKTNFSASSQKRSRLQFEGREIKFPLANWQAHARASPKGWARSGGGVLGEGEMLKSSKSRTIWSFFILKCFCLIETSPSPSGVSLVRFFPLVERNEHKNIPINQNLKNSILYPHIKNAGAWCSCIFDINKRLIMPSF